MGTGGTPEGVLAAAALKAMGGEIFGTDDLVRGGNCFFAATGITDGDLVRGVH